MTHLLPHHSNHAQNPQMHSACAGFYHTQRLPCALGDTGPIFQRRRSLESASGETSPEHDSPARSRVYATSPFLWQPSFWELNEADLQTEASSRRLRKRPRKPTSAAQEPSTDESSGSGRGFTCETCGLATISDFRANEVGMAPCRCSSLQLHADQKQRTPHQDLNDDLWFDELGSSQDDAWNDIHSFLVRGHLAEESVGEESWGSCVHHRIEHCGDSDEPNHKRLKSPTPSLGPLTSADYRALLSS
eukprot:TRINITY_DN371_c0_g1_i3.p1 TRINITY_DN371_c0_g1~~TRINITY_DN371_c0_g1_i3.p1  ORF type:complete len:247 (+),score=0.12 TRINITY_DN371_c0_g1_i3:250-990(+)